MTSLIAKITLSYDPNVPEIGYDLYQEWDGYSSVPYEAAEGIFALS